MPKWLTFISGCNPRLKSWLTVISGSNPCLIKWLTVISDCNPRLKQRFAITSDSNPGFTLGKTRRQKDGCSSYRVKFTWAWITLYPCFHRNSVRFSALFLEKEEKSSFIPKTLSSMILQEIFCGSQGGNRT